MRPRLIPNAKRTLRKAWSVRLMIVAAVLTGAEAIMPFFSDSISRGTFAVVSFLVIVGAFISRFIVQKELHDE